MSRLLVRNYENHVKTNLVQMMRDTNQHTLINIWNANNHLHQQLSINKMSRLQSEAVKLMMPVKEFKHIVKLDAPTIQLNESFSKANKGQVTKINFEIKQAQLGLQQMMKEELFWKESEMHLLKWVS